MKYIVVELISNTATFKNPEFQNFHKTLTLPPPTTLIGVAGAALGMSPKSSQDFFDENKFTFGVFGKSLGLAKDTWKYTNKTSGNELYNYHPNYLGSVITKEILIKNTFYLCFGTMSETAIEQLKQAFLYPKYALTLGGSDSPAHVKNVFETDKTVFSKNVKDCIVEGDVIDKVLNNTDNTDFFIYVNSEPICYDLPTRFAYETDYGARKVSSISTFSYIGSQMQLNYDIEGIEYKKSFIPLNKL